MSVQPPQFGHLPAPYLVSIGNIHATQHELVTPSGTWPLAEVNVASADQTSTTTRTPTWAIVLVVVLIWFFLLSLLFLLIRETRIQGYISVTVTHSSGQSYFEQIPITSEVARSDVFGRLMYLQSLIGGERSRLSR